VGSSGRGTLLSFVAIAAAIALIAILVTSGSFSSDDEADRNTTVAASAQPASPDRGAAGEPEIETIRIGGRPTDIAATQGAVWVTDPSTSECSAIDTGAGAHVTRFRLPGPTAAVGAGEDAVYYALQEQKALERLDPLDPGAAGDSVDLGGFASAIDVEDGDAWVLIEHGVERLDAASGEVADETSAGGFTSGLAVDDGAVWTIADNRDVVRIDAETGDVADDSPEIPDAYGVAAGEGSVWVVSATGTVTQIDPESLAVVGRPVSVSGALDVAIGEGAVWVTSLKKTVTRLDPATGTRIGDPLPVGDEPSSVSIGEGAVWVANAGDGTVTRIEP
jgi:DNA-binding beta-propeller fold protein YncE